MPGILRPTVIITQLLVWVIIRNTELQLRSLTDGCISGKKLRQLQRTLQEGGDILRYWRNADPNIPDGQDE